MLRDDRRRVGDQLRPVAANDLIKGEAVALANKLHQTGIRLASNCDPSQAVAPVVAVPVHLTPLVDSSAPLPRSGHRWRYRIRCRFVQRPGSIVGRMVETRATSACGSPARRKWSAPMPAGAVTDPGSTRRRHLALERHLPCLLSSSGAYLSSPTRAEVEDHARSATERLKSGRRLRRDEHGAHSHDQFLRRERLSHVVVGPCLEAARRRTLLDACREEEHGHPAKRRVAPDAPRLTSYPLSFGIMMSSTATRGACSE